MQKDEGSARQQKTKPNEQDITLPDVRPLVRQIVGRFHPKKVILFGSCAYGEPHEGSDLHLLVVVPNPPQRREAWRITAELGERYPCPCKSSS